MGNVMTWKQALDNKHEPRLYNYRNCPAGITDARLDFKIWAKHTAGIVCFFTTAAEDIKFQVTVFRRSDESYKLIDSELDFTTCPVNCIYHLEMGKNTKGNSFIKTCLLLPGENSF